MRILHVQRTDGISGSERHLLALLPGLVAAGHDVRMVVLERPGGERFTQAVGTAGVDARGVRVGRLPLSPRSVRALRAELRAFRADVVHTHLVHADVVGAVAAMGAGIVRVSTVHSTAAHYRRPAVRAAAAAAGRSADRVIAISHHVARFVVDARLARPDRVRTVHYGIDLDQWTVAPVTRERWSWGQDETVFVVASRLVRDKGHDVAIRALASAAAHRDDLRLAIVGDGPLRAPLEALVAELGVGHLVRFLGYQSDMQAVFAAADVVLFPTGEGFGEGFGLVNLEAMASGRPVVGSRVASLPEIVEEGVTGLLIMPDDVEGFASAMARLAASPEERRAFGDAGRQRAVDRFSVQRMVQETQAVYGELLG